MNRNKSVLSRGILSIFAVLILGGGILFYLTSCTSGSLIGESLDEDCLTFDPQQVRILEDGNEFFLTDGNSRMMLFDSMEKAYEAARVIWLYQLDSQCFANRPNAGLRYFKSGDDIPSGEIYGEDCRRLHDIQNLSIREASSDLFQIIDDNSIPYAAKSKEEAEKIIEIVNHYNVGYTCYVDRPDPGMVYLRR
ncbi:MAG: hypothetical protein LAT80_12870 [Balneolaceae bacterium]|nr:hypothetical protein [Balneolaceae bacterium]